MLLGLDIGSTTVKLVVVAAPGQAPRWHRYLRHHGDPVAVVRRELADGLDGAAAPGAVFSPYATGSNAERIAAAWGAGQVHEVAAVAAAVRRRHAMARTAIEIGGQDAKLIAWPAEGAAPEAAMNERCAAGTGVVIERCLRRLGVTADVAATIVYQPARVRAVATKCGVFAETDLVNLARRGVPVDELVISLADAIVVQCLAVLARGVELHPGAVLLGGPHVYLPALAAAWRHHLGRRWREAGRDVVADDVVVPPRGLLYAALGACDLGAERWPDTGGRTARELADALVGVAPGEAAVLDRPLPPPPSMAPPVTRAPRPGRALAVAIGVDAGSTAVKAVALDGDGVVVARARVVSREPTADGRAVLAALDVAAAAGGHRLAIERIGVTGYGAPALAAMLGADAEVIETVAHATAARLVDPDVEVVCDVGGQDIKVLRLDRAGGIRDFWLSSQCSAGVGAALDGIAAELGVAPAELAARALAARRAPWFGADCTVFLDTARVAYQRLGFAPGELLAGIARAVPRIVWTHVTNGVPPAALGRRFVLQGGVHGNAAVIAAHVDHLARAVPGAVIAVHPDPAAAGAIGAALAAAAGARRPRPDVAELGAAAVTVRSDEATRCRVCPSRCARTFITVAMPGRAPALAVAGHACAEGAEPDRPPAERARARHRKAAVPNLVAREARLLFAPTPVVPLARRADRPRIGIPRVLAMYRAAPLFAVYLASLGAEVVWSPPTDAELWRAGARWGTNDPCFPVKLALAHVDHLLRRVHDRGQRLDALLVPHLTHAQIAVRGVADSASCPVVTASPALVRSALGAELARRGIALCDPLVTMTRRALLERQLHQTLGALLGVDRATSDAACARGLAALQRVRDRLADEGAAVLAGIADGRWPAATVLLGRPYHLDPGINHRVPEEIVALGLPVLSITSLPRDPARWSLPRDPARWPDVTGDPFDIGDVFPGCANSGAAERVWAARLAAAHGRLAVVDLSSFKCGQDPPTHGPIRNLLEDAGVVSCGLHDLDETRPPTSLRVRLRTFAAALAARGMLP